MKFKNITIVGLGLMGGSLAAACRKKFPSARITGVSRNKAALRLALRKKWIHQASNHMEDVCRAADLIVLCTPVDTLQPFLLRLDRAAKKGALVTDVGSVKGEICGWAQKKKWKNIRFVGAHPMAGSHERGIEAASAALYQSGFTFVVRGAGAHAAAFSAVKNFWKKISGKIVVTSASEHDRAVAEISHLPHALASCLVDAVPESSLKFAARGFMDSTRIAQGDASIWTPIFLSNRKAVIQALETFEKRLGSLKLMLRTRRTLPLREFLKRTARKRGNLSV